MAGTAKDPRQASDAETRPGSYFVSNYPPFSEWGSEAIPRLLEKLDTQRENKKDRDLGIYFHIPFCRKRCQFCFFKVYTDKNGEDVEAYMRSLTHELQLYADKSMLRGRDVDFIYFGGGTPSYLSADQLTRFHAEVQHLVSWDKAQEISFEAEPGTLNSEKLNAIKEIGTTRLSLGVESFCDGVLAANGRSHKLVHILDSYEKARDLNFGQINIDLIAGLQAETEDSWHKTIRRTLELMPDSVTIYQLEVPLNTILFKQMQSNDDEKITLHNWDTKYQWMQQAFEELERAGYTLTSAYTAVRDPVAHRFLYRDSLWHGADLIALGISSVGHLKGSLYQNKKDFNQYIADLGIGALPIRRGHELSQQEAMIRQFVLQLKLGRVSMDYFVKEFGVALCESFHSQIRELSKQHRIKISDNEIILEREALIKIDALLPMFYLPQHQSINYQQPQSSKN
jgi:oxygen-independent coproporphyrinogen-3 oxidase